MKKYLKEHEWLIIEDQFSAEMHESSESIFSIGNGKMGMRANFEESYSGKSLQGTYIAGVYYPDKTRVGWWKNGYPEYFAKVLNAPNWMGLTIEFNSQVLDLNIGKVKSFERVLDMFNGTLSRKFIYIFPNGEEIKVDVLRFLSIKQDEIGAYQYKIEVLKGKGEIKITSFIDGDVKNKDSNYDEKFWDYLSHEINPSYTYLEQKTKKTEFKVAFAVFEEIKLNQLKIEWDFKNGIEKEKWAGKSYDFSFEEGDKIEITKTASLACSLYGSNLKSDAVNNLNNALKKGFNQLLSEHKEEWNQKWKYCDIRIEGDVPAQQGIRFNIFQLNCTYTGKDPRLNIGPKGFTGEKYGGSTYWDTEAYCLPFYLSTAEPKVSWQLLEYRYKQLDKAIENAQKLGFNNGAALYPMVTMNGEECHNEWEITFEEIHRNGAIAFAIYNHANYTGNDQWIYSGGLEVLTGIARFWAQRVNWSGDKKKYVILGVTGPNEYENNVNNNWYTNYIAAWCLNYALKCVQISQGDKEFYQNFQAKTQISESELDFWKMVADEMYYPESHELGVFLQQDSYLDKELLNADQLNPSERPINQHWSWDRILRSCFIKQADVLQGLYFFNDHFDIETIKRNFDFYEPKTVHESSLSPCVHVVLAAQLGYQEKAYELYLRTSRLDLDDYNKEVHEGLHITSMAGTWMAVVQGFGGMKVRNNMLQFKPSLPKNWTSFSFKIRFRDRLIEIITNKDSMKAYLLEGEALDIEIDHQLFQLDKEKPALFSLLQNA